MVDSDRRSSTDECDFGAASLRSVSLVSAALRNSCGDVTMRNIFSEEYSCMPCIFTRHGSNQPIHFAVEIPSASSARIRVIAGHSSNRPKVIEPANQLDTDVHMCG